MCCLLYNICIFKASCIFMTGQSGEGLKALMATSELSLHNTDCPHLLHCCCCCSKPGRTNSCTFCSISHSSSKWPFRSRRINAVQRRIHCDILRQHKHNGNADIPTMHNASSFGLRTMTEVSSIRRDRICLRFVSNETLLLPFCSHVGRCDLLRQNKKNDKMIVIGTDEGRSRSFLVSEKTIGNTPSER